MKYGGRVMLAVAGGYVLGRTKKMKLAIMLAGMASGNKIARDPTQLLAQGTRLVQSNPQLSALSDQVRGRLVEAGKDVAVAVVSRQMDSLSDRLSERTDRLSGRLDEDTGEAADRADEAADRSDDDRGTDTSGAGDRTVARDRTVAGPPRKRKKAASTAASRSDKAAGSTARHRTAGSSREGGRNA